MSNVGQQMASGALSGFASTVCLQPFDLLKTRIQQTDGRPRPGTHRPAALLDTVRQVLAESGPRGLWRGTSATLVRNVPGVALYMTGLTQLRAFMARAPLFSAVHAAPAAAAADRTSVLPKLTSTGNLLAGATTRVAVGFLLNPVSVLKARFESNVHPSMAPSLNPLHPSTIPSATPHPPSLPTALLALLRAGPAEYLRGFLASALRDAPYAGLFVLSYEAVKKHAATLAPTGTPPPAIHSASAAAAGALATLATHPFDVIKTKIQVRPEDRYRGFLRTCGTVWRQRGPLGFLDGVSLRLSRKVLSSVIGWAVYEGVLLCMHERGVRV
ncbi:solute carrier family 25 member 38 [Schizophyllum fasciatum]